MKNRSKLVKILGIFIVFMFIFSSIGTVIGSNEKLKNKSDTNELRNLTSNSEMVEFKTYDKKEKASKSGVEESNNNKIHLKQGTINTDEPKLSTQNENNTLYENCEEKYYIIQFTDNIKNEWLEEIKRIDIEVIGYIPEDSYLINADSKEMEKLTEYDFIKYIELYKPEYKISPSINTSKSEINVSITCFDDAEIDKTINKLDNDESQIIDTYKNKIIINTTPSEVAEYAKFNSVKWISPHKNAKMLNNKGREITKADVVHNNYELKGNGQTVGVADTGLDEGEIDNSDMHPDLVDSIIGITNYTGSSAKDVSGHGTHVSGSIIGDGTLSDGKFKGTAPNASLYFQSIENDDGALDPHPLKELFTQAHNNDVNIHSNSWGLEIFGDYSEYAKTLDDFMWDHKNMLVVFSAGNAGENYDEDKTYDPETIVQPATAKNSLTVGASRSDHKDNMTSFSSRGPTEDGRIKPDVVAPGKNIMSTRSSYGEDGSGDYVELDGTSMAAPLTTGTAALLRQYYTDIHDYTPSAALLKTTLINSAEDISPNDCNNTYRRPNNAQGWGLVNVGKSINMFADNDIKFSDRNEIESDEYSQKQIYIDNTSKEFKTTLSWTDAPPSDTSGKALVNDLDLTVTAPNGTEYYGNAAMTPNDTHDSTNNIEQVFIENPVKGTYTVKVDASSMDPKYSPQPFSVVMSGGFGYNDTYVRDLNINQSDKTIYDNQSIDFNTTLYNDENEQIAKDVNWKCNNTSVGTVNSVGLFTANKSGTAEITASCDDGKDSVNVTVEKQPPVLSNINITNTISSIFSNESHDFDAKCYDQYDRLMDTSTNIRWSSSNSTVGSINDSGYFTGNKSGITDIEAKNGSINTSYTLNVKQLPEVENISIINTTHNMYPFDKHDFEVSCYDQYDNKINPDITWSSNNSTVATVNNNGVITPKHPGDTIISAKNDSVKDTANIHVYDSISKRYPNQTNIETINASEKFVLSTHDDYDVVWSLNGNVVKTTENTNMSEYVNDTPIKGSHILNATVYGPDNTKIEHTSWNWNVSFDPKKPSVDINHSRDKRISKNAPTTINISNSGDSIEKSILTIIDDNNNIITKKNITNEVTDDDIYKYKIPNPDDDILQNETYGDYILKVNSTNTAGYSTTKTSTISIDNKDPNSSIKQIHGKNKHNDEIYTNSRIQINSTASGTPGNVSDLVYFIESQSTNFKMATHPKKINDNWTKTVDMSNVSDDGVYTVSMFTKDPAGNTNLQKSSKTFTLDRNKPELSSSVNKKNETHAYVNITSSENLNKKPTVEINGNNIPIQTDEDKWYGIFELKDDMNNYNVNVSGTDVSGNLGTDKSKAMIKTIDTSNKTSELSNNDTGTSIKFNTSKETKSTVSTTETDVSAKKLPENLVGIHFLDVRTGDKLTDNLTNATIAIKVNNSKLPDGINPENVSIRHYNTTNDEWNKVNTNIKTVNNQKYWTSQVKHFSTYGTIVDDDIKPTIDDVYPSNDTKFDSEKSNVKVRFDYSDEQSGINANKTKIKFEGENKSTSENTTITNDYATYNATNLSMGTYNSTVTVYDNAGNSKVHSTQFEIAETSNDENDKDSSSSSDDSGGGGGGSSNTDEELENIEDEFVQQKYVKNGKHIWYNFDNKLSKVKSVHFDATKSRGETDTRLVVLKSNSTMVDEEPPGTAYQNINIWVGKAGFDNIVENASIDFTVDKSWIENNNVDKSTIKMFRHHDDSWDELETTELSENSTTLEYRANTSGFSIFAITGKSKTQNKDVNETNDNEDIQKEPETNTDKNEDGIDENTNAETQSNTENKKISVGAWSPEWFLLATLSMIIFVALYMKKRD